MQHVRSFPRVKKEKKASNMKRLNLRYNRVISSEGCDKDMSNILETVWKIMEENNWIGACHATTSIIYILLSEFGYKPKIYIGELTLPNSFNKFDHSWVEVDGKVIDLAIALPLNPASSQEPVIMGKEAFSNKIPKMIYKSSSHPPKLDAQAQKVKEMPIYTYLEEAPGQIYGFFNQVLQDIIPTLSHENIKEKYSNVYRKVK